MRVSQKKNVPVIMEQRELFTVSCLTTIREIKDFIVWTRMPMEQTACSHIHLNSFWTNILEEFMVKASLHTVGNHTLGHGNVMTIKKTANIVMLFLNNLLCRNVYAA